MSLEKDPQQEDFLQGRMLGNPYSSNEPGLGPLMRDVKNKICQGMFMDFFYPVGFYDMHYSPFIQLPR